MASRSKKEYPFKVITIIPKGSKIGQKNRDVIRNSFHKTSAEAQKEVDSWKSCGFTSLIKNR